MHFEQRLQIMKKLFFSVLISFIALSVKAQEHYQGKVMNDKGKAISFANIALLNEKDSSFITGIVANVDGVFDLNAPTKGLLKVSHMGYDSKMVKGETNTPLTIVLTPNAVQMDEVVVQSVKPVTHLEGDALVTNIKGSLFEKLGTAKDVLGRLPGILNNMGSIEVLGRGTPIYYINGRKVYDGQLLDQLKSDKIKKIEVVMNPGARYDASVKAIIRIVTEREQGAGFSFDSNTKVGYLDYVYGSEQVNMNYRLNKLDIFANLEYTNNRQRGLNSNNETAWLSSTLHQNFDISQRGRQQLYDGKIGFAYTFSPEHSLGLYYKVTHTPAKKWTTLHANSFVNDVLNEESAMEHYSKGFSTSHLVDAYYSGQFGKWSLNATFNTLWKKSNSDNVSDEIIKNGGKRNITTETKVNSRMLAGELHLSKPFWRGQLNFGTELLNSRREENFIALGGLLNNDNPFVKESSASVYAETMQRLGKVMVQLGLRYEHINSEYFRFGKKVKEQSRIYDKLFPTALVTTNFGKVMMQLSYSKKYFRPFYSQLSSTVAYINRYLYESGNPLLRPSYIDNISAILRYNWATLILGYSSTKDKIITSAMQYEGDPNATLYKKMNSKYRMGELQAMIQLSPQFKRYYPTLVLGIAAPFNKIDFRGSIKHLNHPMGIIRMNNIYQLSSSCMLTADFSWRGKGDGENIRIGQTWQINAGAMKNIGKQWELRLTVSDIFNSARKTWFDMYSELNVAHQERDVNTRGIECTVRYKFNTTKSKYKGKGAGNQEKTRL